MTVKFSAIILAAGRGTRMKSALPKPLHKLAHKPMLGYVIDAYRAAGATEIVVVIGPDDTITPALFPDVKYVTQTEQKGTGHAALIGLSGLKKPVDKIIMALGDMPFIKADTITALAGKSGTVTVLAMRPEDPARYGRLIVKDGLLEKIVEYKDATAAERQVNLCNSGTIALDGKKAKALLEAITPSNAAGEYYATDVVAIARNQSAACGVVEAPLAETLAANTREELAALEQIVQTQLRQKHMLNGVTLLDPASVYFAHDTVIANDVVIEPHVFFGPHVTIASNTHILAFSHIEGVTIAAQAEIGPYARIRPGSKIAEKAKIGSFVEIKKTTVGKGSKIPHLSYVGDTTIGKKSNIGGGTITCNYDGFDKFNTIIGDDVLIGAHNALVAPITIHDRAMTAAGSVLTEDVPADALAVARAKQVAKAGWAKLFRQKKEKAPKKKSA